MSEEAPTPISYDEHLVLAERALLSTNALIERIFNPASDAPPPTAADLQGALFAFNAASVHAAIASVQVTADLAAAAVYIARRMGASGHSSGIALVRG